MISVIVPFYNELNRVATCMESLLRQEDPGVPVEIILVNNGGARMLPRLRKILLRYPAVRLVSEKIPSSYAARNRGIRSARGTWLAFTDVDCVPSARWLKECLKTFRKRKNCGLVGGPIELIFTDPDDPNVYELYDRFFFLQQKDYIEKFHFSGGANIFTARAVVKKVGMFDHRLKSGGDWEWGRRVHAAGFKVAYAAGAMIRHHSKGSLDYILKRGRRVQGGMWDLMLPVHADPDALFELETSAAIMDAARQISKVEQLGPVLTPAKARALRMLATATALTRLSELQRLHGGGSSRRA